LSAAARIELRRFISQGGTLILEAGGGSKLFTASAEEELLEIFGDKATPQLVDLENPASAFGSQLQTVQYRQAGRRLLGKLSTPHLRGLEIDGRIAVYPCDEDLGTGLTGVAGESIVGYDPASAQAVMGRLLLSTAATTIPPAHSLK
jgi:hypothetical protein